MSVTRGRARTAMRRTGMRISLWTRALSVIVAHRR